MRFVALVLLLVLPVNCQAWSGKDTALEVISEGMTVVDWGQTQDIRNHNGMIELNPILGRSPSRGAVNAYFISVLAIHPVISIALPESCRTIWQSIYIGVEWTAISSNYNGGLRLSF